MIRRDRIFGRVLIALVLAPCALMSVWFIQSAPERRDGILVLLMTFLILPATIGGVAYAAFDRRGRGLVLRAVRGGPQPMIEVRARSGVGGGLLLPLGGALSTQKVYRIGTKRLVIADASVSTAAGEVVFARGGTSLDPALVRWVEAVAASEGAAQPGEDAADPEALAAAASRDPLAAPAPIEAMLIDGWPTWRYRAAATGAERKLILPWIILLAAWLVVYPALGIFSAGPLWAIVGPVELVLLYLLALTGSVTMEFQVRGTMLVARRKRSGLTLSVGVSEAAQAGIDVVALPAVSLTFGRKWRGATSPAKGGPDVAAMAWLSAAIRACAGTQ